MVVPPPSGGVSQTRKAPGPAVISPVVSGRRSKWTPRGGIAPIMGKLKKSKKQKPRKAQLKKDLTYYLRCPLCRKEEFLTNETNGHQSCKCGWRKK